MNNRRYKYVGPAHLLELAKSHPLRYVLENSDSVLQWMHDTGQSLSQQFEVTATYTVDEDGFFWITDRHCEHIACAHGKPVLAAGEITFTVEQGDVEITYVSNQSTGYCPEPECWGVVSACLQETGMEFPAQFSRAFDFRRCVNCQSINLVKNDEWDCLVCGHELPYEWNFSLPDH